ncbi:Site-specific DNA recombinase [Loktanella sp. DSM 29012]|nr:recombinase family protein [Loktanella sp. DSM 29012]SEQ86958.1 Site-specific DNA recombinase [Loktanella sp. DSM 29012]
MPKLRGAIYARFSTDMQRDASIDDQIRLCKEYAQRQGIEIVATYKDRATSGASLLRSGVQSLIEAATTQKFDVVITEALDRLSRNQADIASLYQRMMFHGVMIETVSEGSISEMHIGLKGTMNALFLKDLAAKTHRGLKGVAIAGKNAGGKAYGYKVVTKLDCNGGLVRGDRTIDPAEARVVNRIFQDYADGKSPKRIAEDLNAEGIPGPTGRAWGASTLHGNRERGTGILNNELYVGQQIWNRLTYAKHPDTGRRISRLNPKEEWVITDVPALRIVDQDLWEAVRARQGALKTKDTSANVWDRRRPRTLFSGLMACGKCGGGFSKVSKDRFGCSRARNKGKSVCDNMLTVPQDDLERLVLDAMQHSLMDKEALEVFCAEYAKERNRLRAEQAAGRAGFERELATIKKDHAKLVDAIIAGVSPDQLKDRMNGLDARKNELEAQLRSLPEEDPIRIHPKMAVTYRDRVAALVNGLTEPDGMEQSKEALRGLIDRIVLVPDSQTGRLRIELEGALASLLHFALGRDLQPKRKSPAGAGFEVVDLLPRESSFMS